MDRPVDSNIDEVSASLTYFGEAAVGSADSDAAWLIWKQETVGTVTSIKYASKVHDQVWDARATLLPPTP